MATAILGLLAETAIHAGAGTSAGVIDLPIQREGHSGWPCVYGSAVKGALRAAAANTNENWVVDVFGPDTSNAIDHAGALAVSDARLLLLPVRSLTSHFKWVTCPALLKRTQADAKRLGIRADFPSLEIAENTAYVPEGSGELFLEEFRFSEQKSELLDRIIDFIAELMGADDAKDSLRKQLVVIGDDYFAHLSKYATPVAAHIAIENETKTVKSGALWYEETLPPETVLYVCLMANGSRRKDGVMSAAAVLDCVTDSLFKDRPYLQLGGNETVGMGWCKVTPVKGGV